MNGAAADARVGVGARVIVVAALLTIGAAVWVAQVELILHTAEISESVPLIAALAGLLALVAWNRVLGGIARLAGQSRAAEAIERWRLSRREIVLVYCFLTLSALMMSAKVSGYLIPATSIYAYFGGDNVDFGEAGRLVPGWLALRDPEVVRQLYEGSDREPPDDLGGGPAGALARATEGLWWPLAQVPWGAWLVPLLAWGAIMGLVLTASLCLLGLLKGRWAEQERLSFPLVMIPLELSSASERIGASAFLRDPGFWVGFVLSASFTLFALLHAISPGLPVLRPYYDLRPLFSEHPWRAVQNAGVEIRPELIGLSYFIDSDIALTVWVTSIANSLLAVGTATLGYQTRDFPRPADQGVGAYVVLAVFLLWSGRAWLGRGLRLALAARRSIEGRRFLALWAGLVGSVGLLIALSMAAGMRWWASAYLFGTVLLFMLVYGRARAETGMPHPSPYPSGLQMSVLEYIGGPASWAGGATPALLGSCFFLGRGYTVTTSGAQIENLKLADALGVRPGAMAGMTVLAPLLGLAAAVVMRLAVSYHYGLNTVEGGGIEGGYAVRQVYLHAEQTMREARLGVARDPAGANAAIFGALTTLALIGLRRVFLRFPLHPLGFCLAMVRLRSFWAPFLLTWAIKAALLRLGGARAYHRAAPAFLGLAIGHYFFAGIVLGALGAAFPHLLERIEVINFD